MLKGKLKRLFDLQIFAEDGEAGNPEGGIPDNGNGGANPNPTPNGGANNGEVKPFAVFPDEKSFMARVNREAKKLSGQAQKDFLNSLGVESAETLQSILADYNAIKENEKSDLQKATERISKLEQENAELQAKIVNGLKHSTIKNLASELGVESKRIERFMKLIDMDSIEVQNGSIDTDAVKDTLVTILDEFPEFKGITSVQTGGGNDFGGDNGGSKKFTMEDIRKMSTQEIQDNWEEVEKVLNSQK